MNNKVFTQGAGRLTADVMNRWQKTSNAVENMGTPYAAGGWEGPKVLRVVSSQPMVARGELLDKGDPDADPPVPPTYDEDITLENRWWYEVEETAIKLPTDLDSNRRTSHRNLTAFNSIEMPNTDTEALGIPVAELPEGFELKPIPNNTFVFGWSTSVPGDKNATDYPEYQGYLLMFSATNQFHGEC